jgi:integrase
MLYESQSQQEGGSPLDSLKNDRWAAIYYLACTGMRKGEILGLPLKALDIEKGFLMVIQRKASELLNRLHV